MRVQVHDSWGNGMSDHNNLPQLNELSRYDFPDTEWVPNGYDEKELITATNRNFQILIDNYNSLVQVVNALIDNDDEHTGDLNDVREDIRDLQR